MLVKTIKIGDHKTEIVKMGENDYAIRLYEHYSNYGWRLLSTIAHYSKEAIEWEYGIKVS